MAAPAARPVSQTILYGPLLKGVTINPSDPAKLEFIIDNNGKPVSAQEAQQLINYFFAGLTVPESDLWVNLSPYEANRIIPDALSVTDAGKGLLEQDYALKRITASAVNPLSASGKNYWQKVYTQTAKRFGMAAPVIETFNKIWIVPERAGVYEQGNTMYVAEARLTTMLEADYVAMRNAVKPVVPVSQSNRLNQQNEMMLQIMKDTIVPVINEDVNTAQEFIQLRQIYHSLILALWFKRRLRGTLFDADKEKNARIRAEDIQHKSASISALFGGYFDSSKVRGIDTIPAEVKHTIYQAYVNAFTAGKQGMVLKEKDVATGALVRRKYFSGGTSFAGSPAWLGPRNQPPQFGASPVKNVVIRITPVRNQLKDKINNVKEMIARADMDAYKEVERVFNDSGDVWKDFSRLLDSGVIDRAFPFLRFLPAYRREHTLTVFRKFCALLENNPKEYNFFTDQVLDDIPPDLLSRPHDLLTMVMRGNNRLLFLLAVLTHDIGVIVSGQDHHAIGMELAPEIIKQYAPLTPENDIRFFSHFMRMHVDMGGLSSKEKSNRYFLNSLSQYSQDADDRLRMVAFLSVFTLADELAEMDPYIFKMYLDYYDTFKRTGVLCDDSFVNILECFTADYRGKEYSTNVIRRLLSQEDALTDRKVKYLETLVRHNHQVSQVKKSFMRLPEETRQFIKNHFSGIDIFNYALYPFRYLSGDIRPKGPAREGSFENFIKLFAVTAFLISKNKTARWVDFSYDLNNRWDEFEVLDKNLHRLGRLEDLTIEELSRRCKIENNEIAGIQGIFTSGRTQISLEWKGKAGSPVEPARDDKLTDGNKKNLNQNENLLLAQLTAPTQDIMRALRVPAGPMSAEVKNAFLRLIQDVTLDAMPSNRPRLISDVSARFSQSHALESALVHILTTDPNEYARSAAMRSLAWVFTAEYAPETIEVITRYAPIPSEEPYVRKALADANERITLQLKENGGRGGKATNKQEVVSPHDADSRTRNGSRLVEPKNCGIADFMDWLEYFNGSFQEILQGIRVGKTVIYPSVYVGNIPMTFNDWVGHRVNNALQELYSFDHIMRKTHDYSTLGERFEGPMGLRSQMDFLESLADLNLNELRKSFKEIKHKNIPSNLLNPSEYATYLSYFAFCENTYAAGNQDTFVQGVKKLREIFNRIDSIVAKLYTSKKNVSVSRDNFIYTKNDATLGDADTAGKNMASPVYTIEQKQGVIDSLNGMQELAGQVSLIVNSEKMNVFLGALAEFCKTTPVRIESAGELEVLKHTLNAILEILSSLLPQISEVYRIQQNKPRYFFKGNTILIDQKTHSLNFVYDIHDKLRKLCESIKAQVYTIETEAYVKTDRIERCVENARNYRALLADIINPQGIDLHEYSRYNPNADSGRYPFSAYRDFLVPYVHFFVPYQISTNAGSPIEQEKDDGLQAGGNAASPLAALGQYDYENNGVFEPAMERNDAFGEFLPAVWNPAELELSKESIRRRNELREASPRIEEWFRKTYRNENISIAVSLLGSGLKGTSWLHSDSDFCIIVDGAEYLPEAQEKLTTYIKEENMFGYKAQHLLVFTTQHYFEYIKAPDHWYSELPPTIFMPAVYNGHVLEKIRREFFKYIQSLPHNERQAVGYYVTMHALQHRRISYKNWRIYNSINDVSGRMDYDSEEKTFENLKISPHRLTFPGLYDMARIYGVDLNQSQSESSGEPFAQHEALSNQWLAGKTKNSSPVPSIQDVAQTFEGVHKRFNTFSPIGKSVYSGQQKKGGVDLTGLSGDINQAQVVRKKNILNNGSAASAVGVASRMDNAAWHNDFEGLTYSVVSINDISPATLFAGR